jgi:hypothetical protein
MSGPSFLLRPKPWSHLCILHLTFVDTFVCVFQRDFKSPQFSYPPQISLWYNVLSPVTSVTAVTSYQSLTDTPKWAFYVRSCQLSVQNSPVISCCTYHVTYQTLKCSVNSLISSLTQTTTTLALLPSLEINKQKTKRECPQPQC